MQHLVKHPDSRLVLPAKICDPRDEFWQTDEESYEAQNALSHQKRSGDMGYTFRPEGGGEEDAMEGEFCNGPTDAVCDPAQRRGDDGFAVPGVRHLTQDWL